MPPLVNSPGTKISDLFECCAKGERIQRVSFTHLI